MVRAKDGFELELDHLIDFATPMLSSAATGISQIDFPNIANEYLQDLDRVESLAHAAVIAEPQRVIYTRYIAEFRHLLTLLGLLPVPTAGYLGFRQYALDSFRFLIDEYTFRLTESSPNSARFASDTIYVTVTYSPKCPMNSITVCHSLWPEQLLILDDFNYVKGNGVLFDYERFNLHESQGIARFLFEASVLVHSQGGPILSGDEDHFRDFLRGADERERLYIQMMEITEN